MPDNVLTTPTSVPPLVSKAVALQEKNREYAGVIERLIDRRLQELLSDRQLRELFTSGLPQSSNSKRNELPASASRMAQKLARFAQCKPAEANLIENIIDGWLRALEKTNDA